MNISKDNKCSKQYTNNTFEADNNNAIYGNANHMTGVSRKYNFL